MSSATNDRSAPSRVRSRFAWPMRLFLSALVFDMVARSFIALTPVHEVWLDELGMQRLPMGLPTATELAQIEAGTHPQAYQSPSRRWQALGPSVGRFFVPWPSPQTRAWLDSPAAYGKFTVTWLGTRLNFIGSLVGVDQNWPMFSPNVRRRREVARSRLFYADGSQRVVRVLADPTDLAHYSHWFQEKHLAQQLKVPHDWEARMGYCNYLAHEHPTTETGAALVRIEISTVYYVYPPPGPEAAAQLVAQSGPPAEQTFPPFWRYDVKTRCGYRMN